MKLPRNLLRAPILLAAVLVVAGVGYASYTATATVTAGSSSASFYILITGLSDPGAPSNIVTFHWSPALPAQTVTLNVSTLLSGQTVLVDYTFEDFGSIAATNVGESIVETHFGCDGELAMAQSGPAPTLMTPLVPYTAAFTLTDYTPPGPAPPPCSYPFTSSWTLTISADPV